MLDAIRTAWLRGAAAAALAVSVAACEDVGTTTGQVEVRLTDVACSDIASAEVWISEVYLVGGTDPSGPRYTISDQEQSYDLLDLQNGVTAALGTATIPTGDYTQMRMVVDSGKITLGNGLLFAGGSATRTLTVPSGAQTGIKVNFAGPVTVTPGQTILVVDFDVCRSFRFQGPPSMPTGAHFQPVLHAVVADVAGSIAGAVSPAAANAMVYGIVGADTVATAQADGTTGAYSLLFLPPGTYTVAASATGYQDASVSNVVVGDAQHVTGVNITLTLTP